MIILPFYVIILSMLCTDIVLHGVIIQLHQKIIKVKAMKHSYKTKGVCSRRIDFELDGDRVRNIKFHGGCKGNLQALSILTDGMSVGEVTEKLAGNRCGHKSTSCADQLTIALNKALDEETGK